MSIVTGSGDDGKTSLFGGKRVPKHHPRLEAYGSVDEAQSAIGMVRASIASIKSVKSNPDIQEIGELLKKAQIDLHAVGADLASPNRDAKVPRVDPDMISSITEIIKRLEQKLPELKSFILPSGSEAATTCFWARSVARRAERAVSILVEQGEDLSMVLIYMNRLSDLLFVIGRILNRVAGCGDEVVG
jgi:cob(I)alamin adenosyltransferase